MMDLGSELRHARERSGLSLSDIASRTKIRAATLLAIENNDLDRLPPPIFTRGFLRIYAREVGLDPDAMTDRYAAGLPAPDGVRTNVAPASDNEGPETVWSRFDITGPQRSSIETAALIVLGGLLVVLLNRWPSSPSPTPPHADAPRAVSARGQSATKAVATTGSPASAASRRGIVRLEFLTRGPCWIAATVDGNKVIYELAGAGASYAIEGFDEVKLTVGEPAAFAFTIDGASGRSLGPPGRPATVRLTRANAHEFVATH